MGNPYSIANGQEKELDLITDNSGTVGLKRAYGAENDFGGDNPAMHQGVAIIPATAGDTDVAVAAALSAAIGAVAGQVGYLLGFEITGLGATSGGVIEATITGLAIGTLTFDVTVPAGATTAIVPISRVYPNPLAGSAANTAIVLDVPSFGTGNTAARCAIWGYTSA